MLLRKGSRGSEVKNLQQNLVNLSYDPKGIDGIFGSGTDKAVKAFQYANKLVVDGIVGPATLRVFDTVKKQQYIVLRPNEYTTIVKINRDKIEKLDVILANTKTNRETLSSMKKRTGVDLIINGGLYWTDTKSISHSLNLLIDNNKQNNSGIYSRFGLRTFMDGSYEFDWYKYSKDLNDMIGGSPSLVVNSKINVDTGNMKGSLITARHPRSAIGMNNDYFFLVAIDGRRTGMPGMTINELAKYMLSLGSISAINLDGGGSTRIEDKNRALNAPLENRPIHNGIGIKLRL